MSQVGPAAGGSKLFQKSQIVFVKQSDIIDGVSDHGNALDAKAEGPTAPDVRVVADIFEDLRVHHAATGEFEPVLAHFANQRAGEIDFEAWLSVGEIVRTKPEFDFTAEQFLKDELDGPFEITHRDA